MQLSSAYSAFAKVLPDDAELFYVRYYARDGVAPAWVTSVGSAQWDMSHLFLDETSLQLREIARNSSGALLVGMRLNGSPHLPWRLLSENYRTHVLPKLEHVVRPTTYSQLRLEKYFSPGGSPNTPGDSSLL